MAERYPEITLARRLVARYNLEPPVDVAALIRRYADLHIERIPFDVDGLCIDLKVPKKRPKVILNSNKSEVRQRFTLAHELGHLIIPWHVGNIIDQISDADEVDDFEYWMLEAEANRFASEVLMPTEWVSRMSLSYTAPPDALREIRQKAQTSAQAASLKLIQCLPPNFVYSRTEEGHIVASSKSPDTKADIPQRGSWAAPDIYPYASGYWVSGDHHWWKLDAASAPTASDSSKSWREVLDVIIADIGVPPDEIRRFKGSFNGIVSNANSSARSRSRIDIYNFAIQRIWSNATRDVFIKRVATHPLRDDFLALRIDDFLNKKIVD